MFNSLSQTLIKIISPGVPDFYQGSELWNLSLVDPDNRRPVDYQMRKQFLSDIKEKFSDSPKKLTAELLNTKTDGRIKLFLIWKALKVKAENKTLFQKGAYKLLQVEGKHKENVIAFARSYDTEFMITIVPRFLTQIISENQLPIGKQWQDTHITSDFNPANWINCITDQQLHAQKKIYISDALSDFPVCLLKTQ
jgi:(1->4)-alpha-D-glucan 1-alpha-D-glucosylmutase